MSNIQEEIKCPNFKICETIIPKWYYGCHNGVCRNCDMFFGNWNNKIRSKSGNNLIFRESVECPICHEENVEGVEMPKCNHAICISCFKRCFNGDESRDEEPEFPYPEIEDEYDEDPDNKKWEIDYPLIRIYHEELSRWDDERQAQYDREEYLRKCSLCRD